MTQKKWKLIGVSHNYKVGVTPSSQQQLVALDRVTFSQDYGEIVGLIGGKDSGKSTLASILLETLRPSEGIVTGHTDTGVAFSLPKNRNSEQTGEKYTTQHLLKWGIPKKKVSDLVCNIHEFSELGDLYFVKLKSYSNEEKSQLAISILLCLGPTMLYIDESLLKVKEPFYIKVRLQLLKLKELGSSIWIETEHVKRIEDYCDKLVWLEFGKLQSHGDVTSVLTSYYDYYYDIQRLTLNEQQRLWSEGYREQLRAINLIQSEELIERKKETGLPEVAVLPPLDVIEGTSLERNNEEKSTLTRTVRSRQRKRLSRRERYLWGGLVTSCVLVIVLVISGFNYYRVNAGLQKTLPNTKGEGTGYSRLTLEESEVNESNRSSTQQSTEALVGENESYTVQKGETLSQIADRLGLSLTFLREWNHLTTDEIHPNQVLTIKGPQIDPEPNVKVSELTHQVENGETLDVIAEAYGVSVADIQKVNQLDHVTIYSGTILSLPEGAKELVKSPKEDKQVLPVNREIASEADNSYTVSSGETLYGIAKKFGIDVMALQQTNALQTEQLSPGQVLVIP